MVEGRLVITQWLVGFGILVRSGTNVWTVTGKSRLALVTGGARRRFCSVAWQPADRNQTVLRHETGEREVQSRCWSEPCT